MNVIPVQKKTPLKGESNEYCYWSCLQNGSWDPNRPIQERTCRWDLLLLLVRLSEIFREWPASIPARESSRSFTQSLGSLYFDPVRTAQAYFPGVNLDPSNESTRNKLVANKSHCIFRFCRLAGTCQSECVSLKYWKIALHSGTRSYRIVPPTRKRIWISWNVFNKFHDKGHEIYIGYFSRRAWKNEIWFTVDNLTVKKDQ